MPLVHTSNTEMKVCAITYAKMAPNTSSIHMWCTFSLVFNKCTPTNMVRPTTAIFPKNSTKSPIELMAITRSLLAVKRVNAILLAAKNGEPRIAAPQKDSCWDKFPGIPSPQNHSYLFQCTLDVICIWGSFRRNKKLIHNTVALLRDREWCCWYLSVNLTEKKINKSQLLM